MSFADVESANVVGYTTLTIASKYQIIGVNFQKVSGGSLKLNDAIPYQDGMTKGNGTGSADQIQIGDDAGNWIPYYMSNGKNGKGKDVDGIEGKWCPAGKFAAADVELTPGTSFWYVRNDATQPAFNLSIAGSVTTLPSAEYAFASKYRIFANPYPVPLALNTAFPYVEETMTKGNGTGSADQIQIGDNEGNWTPYYLSNGKNGKGKDVDGIDGKWCPAGKFVDANASIPVGKAAWYVRNDTSKPAMQVNWTKPYDL